jgi:PAS domain S-box-containing protein
VGEDLSTALFPWAYQKVIIQHEVVSVATLDEMPPEASVDTQTYREWGIRSHLNIPIVMTGSQDYIISINAVRSERAWPEEYIPRLRLLGEIFVNALERQRAEGMLRESEARFRQMADVSPVMIWMSGLDKGCTYLNEGWLEFTGRTLEEELGNGWAEGVHPDDLERCLNVYATSFDRREPFRMEYRLRRADGEFRWVDDTGIPRISPVGDFLGYIGSCIDITEHKRMEEQLQARLTEIENLKRRLEEENVYLREEMRFEHGHDDIVGQSDAKKRVLAQIEQVARTDSTVLIVGETGTGKEVIARAIHNLSRRKDRALVTVNCASLPPSLIESELFGREKGAYTGAMTMMKGRFEFADGSTLFLDEIGELPLEAQVKLLRVLEEGRFERLGSSKTVHVDVRILAATNRDLPQDALAGRFRKDLYYRLNVFTIVIPPLRERPEDIPLLAWAFVREFERKMGKRIESIPKRTMEALRHYPWPGNVRELRNVIENAMIVSASRTLEVGIPTSSFQQSSTDMPATGSLENVERKHILEVLQKTGWRVTGKGGAAELLGLKRTTLQSRMNKLGIKRPTS